MRTLRDDEGNILDRALMLLFPGPASATGEDLVEMHCHGGRAVVEAVERALFARPGVRRAGAGEFTRRALLNGRIDLTQAEGLADLLEAETEQQRRSAIAAAEGQVSRAVRGWLDRLVMLSAEVEASIDYAEEGDVAAEAASLETVIAAQRALADDMAAVLAAPPVERWHDGFRVVVAGPPNAGKSTLVNLLGQRDAAIVSPIAGTTRDRIEVAVRRNGVGYVLIDTAGLRDDSDDLIELTGMERSREAAAVADLVIWLGDDQLDTAASTLWLWSKADLPGRDVPPDGCALAVSASRPETTDHLWALIERTQLVQLGSAPFLLHQRIRHACDNAFQSIRAPSEDAILLAEELRAARGWLTSALGGDASDLMMSALFSRFCVGK